MSGSSSNVYLTLWWWSRSWGHPMMTFVICYRTGGNQRSLKIILNRCQMNKAPWRLLTLEVGSSGRFTFSFRFLHSKIMSPRDSNGMRSNRVAFWELSSGCIGAPKFPEDYWLNAMERNLFSAYQTSSDVSCVSSFRSLLSSMSTPWSHCALFKVWSV